MAGYAGVLTSRRSAASPTAGGRGRRRLGATGLLLAVLVTAYAVAEPVGPGAPARLLTVGVAGSPGDAVVLDAVPPGAAYVPGSSVLRVAAGRVVAGRLPAPAATANPDARTFRQSQREERSTVAASRAWLYAGRLPGITTVQRDMAERALLDLRMLTLPSGAVLAGPRGIWAYTWPRDASFAAAAYAVTGHLADADRVLADIATRQRADGTWAARTTPDGRVPDGRPDQLDACGWFPWAVRLVYQEHLAARDVRGAGDLLARTAPALRLAVRAVAQRVDEGGVADTSQDYWENKVAGPTLGIAGPLAAGMAAAADLGTATLGAQAATANALARRLRSGLAADWDGVTRYRFGEGGADAAAAWLGPPFAPAPPHLQNHLRRAERLLRAPNGGLRPGQRFTDPNTSWTPETAMFAVAYAASGQPARAERLLGWLAGHRTSLGALPEKVSATGGPASVAPLAWTDAAVLLALSALEHGLPAPPS